VGALLAAGHAAGLGWIYLAGLAVVAAMLIWEHAILRPSDLSRLNVAFFNLNGYVSVIYFAATLVDVLARR
jgi:4-hydroxybenzoate polyprenyltransferase